MLKDFFGLLKMVTSICIVIFNLFVTIPLVIQDLSANQFGELIGVCLGSILMTLFAVYIFHSGWTEFKDIKIKRPIFIWIGAIVAGIGGVGLCFRVDWFSMTIGLIFITISIQDIARMVRTPVSKGEAAT